MFILKNCAYSLIIVLDRLFPRHEVPVLMYHSISDKPSKLAIPQNIFNQHLNIMRKAGYATISPEELLVYFNSKRLPKRKVIITFDDGFEDNYYYAAPLLNKYNFQAIFFINFGYLGQRAVYCTDPIDQQRKIMTSHQLKELGKKFIIGNHFYSHKVLTDLDKNQIDEEFSNNFSALKKILNEDRHLYFVAFPKNKTNDQIITILKNHGVRLAFAGKNRHLRSDDSPFEIPRIDTHSLVPNLKFRAKLSPYYDFFSRIII